MNDAGEAPEPEQQNPYRSPKGVEPAVNRSSARWWIRSGNWQLLLASAAVQAVLWNMYLNSPPRPELQNILCVVLLFGMAILLAWRIVLRLQRHHRHPTRARPPRP